MDALRDRIATWFGDWEIWVDPVLPGNVFTTDVARIFTSRNFDYFLYDLESNEIALLPAKGMHKHSHDPMEHLPNADESNRLRAGDKLMVYHLNDDNDKCGPEAHGDVSRADWIRDHPKNVSLLV